MRSLHWLLHNTVGHPIAGILWFVSDITGKHGFSEVADLVHDITCP
jgi:predicted xylose isomerase-like sugar epimerase